MQSNMASTMRSWAMIAMIAAVPASPHAAATPNPKSMIGVPPGDRAAPRTYRMSIPRDAGQPVLARTTETQERRAAP